MNGWSLPRIATRTGASHRRRGISCQDASGWLGLCGEDAQPVWALAVADGHGGARHQRSRTGSVVACRVALDLIAAELPTWTSNAADDLDPLRHTLEDTLPERIVRRWREQVWRHWQDEPPDNGEPFTPILYGTTLGLLLLTSHWWASTGLGDWDLVRIDGDGRQRLLSEEGNVGGQGEATCSLCLGDAPARFQSRTQVHSLPPGEPPFALLLSTDGIRKSCGTEQDFLILASYLTESDCSDQTLGQLAADLDRISSEGSGDDVSVAIARWNGQPDGQMGRLTPTSTSAWIEQPPAVER